MGLTVTLIGLGTMALGVIFLKIKQAKNIAKPSVKEKADARIGAVIAVVGVVVFMGSFYLNKSNRNNSSSLVTKESDLQTKHDYPAQVIKSFIEGCEEFNPTPDISQTKICKCLIEKIQKKYTIEEFNEISKLQNGDAKWDEYQTFLNETAEDCVKNNSN